MEKQPEVWTYSHPQETQALCVQRLLAPALGARKQAATGFTSNNSDSGIGLPEVHPQICLEGSGGGGRNQSLNSSEPFCVL